MADAQAPQGTQVVIHPTLGPVAFPSTMSDTDITAAFKNLERQAQPSQAVSTPTSAAPNPTAQQPKLSGLASQATGLSAPTKFSDDPVKWLAEKAANIEGRVSTAMPSSPTLGNLLGSTITSPLHALHAAALLNQSGDPQTNAELSRTGAAPKPLTSKEAASAASEGLRGVMGMAAPLGVGYSGVAAGIAGGVGAGLYSALTDLSTIPLYGMGSQFLTDGLKKAGVPDAYANLASDVATMSVGVAHGGMLADEATIAARAEAAKANVIGWVMRQVADDHPEWESYTPAQKNDAVHDAASKVHIDILAEQIEKNNAAQKFTPPKDVLDATSAPTEPQQKPLRGLLSDGSEPLPTERPAPIEPAAPVGPSEPVDDNLPRPLGQTIKTPLPQRPIAGMPEGVETTVEPLQTAAPSDAPIETALSQIKTPDSVAQPVAQVPTWMESSFIPKPLDAQLSRIAQIRGELADPNASDPDRRAALDAEAKKRFSTVQQHLLDWNKGLGAAAPDASAMLRREAASLGAPDQPASLIGFLQRSTVAHDDVLAERQRRSDLRRQGMQSVAGGQSRGTVSGGPSYAEREMMAVEEGKRRATVPNWKSVHRALIEGQEVPELQQTPAQQKMYAQYQDLRHQYAELIGQTPSSQEQAVNTIMGKGMVDPVLDAQKSDISAKMKALEEKLVLDAFRTHGKPTLTDVASAKGVPTAELAGTDTGEAIDPHAGIPYMTQKIWERHYGGRTKGARPTQNEKARKLVELQSRQKALNWTADKLDKLHSQLGSVGEGRRPSLSEGGFYSFLERTVFSKMPERASAEQVANIVRNAGVSKQEISGSTFDTFLAKAQSEGRQLSKREVLDFIDTNKLKLERTVKGAGSAPEMVDVRHAIKTASDNVSIAYEDAKAILRGNNSYSGITGATGTVYSIDDSTANHIIQDLDGYNRPEDMDKRLQTSWGINNPNGRADIITAVQRYQRADEAYEVIAHKYLSELGSAPKYETYTLPGGTNYREVLVRKPLVPVDKFSHEGKEYPIAPEGTYYHSPHFDEPNILFHERLKDRVDGFNKKTLFVEEIQSDWGKDFRQQGMSAEMAAAHGFAKDSVPNFPLEGTWHELAMKDVLRQAVEGGYDQIGWTTGQQQADRYGSSHLEEGGIHHKRLYDEMIPQFLNRYAKKWGAQVGQTEIGTANSGPSIPDGAGGMVGTGPAVQATVHSLPITPAMRSSLQTEGQRLQGGFLKPDLAKYITGAASGAALGGIAGGPIGAGIGAVVGAALELPWRGPTRAALAQDGTLARLAAEGIHVSPETKDISVLKEGFGTLAIVGDAIQRYHPEVAKIATIMRDREIALNTAQRRLSEQLVPILKRMPKTMWEERLVPLLDNENVTPENIAKYTKDEQVQDAYHKVRGLLDQQRLDLIQARRAESMARGYSIEQAVAHTPNDWGIQDGYMLHVFPGDIAIRRNFGTQANPSWDAFSRGLTSDDPLAQHGWLQGSLDDAYAVAHKIRQLHPDWDIQVSKKEFSVPSNILTKEAKLRQLARGLRDTIDQSGPDLDQRLDDWSQRFQAEVYRPPQTAARTFRGALPRKSNLVGWARDKETFVSSMMAAERYIHLVDARPQLMNLRNSIAQRFDGERAVHKISELPKRHTSSVLGLVDGSIEAFEGYPSVAETVTNKAYAHVTNMVTSPVGAVISGAALGFGVAGPPGALAGAAAGGAVAGVKRALKGTKEFSPDDMRLLKARALEFEAMSKLGLNPASALKVLMASGVNAYTINGAQYGAQGMAAFAHSVITKNSPYKRLLQNNGIYPSGLMYDVDTVGEYMKSYLPQTLGEAPGALWRGVRNASLWAFNDAYYAARGATFLGAYLKAKAGGGNEAEAVNQARHADVRTHFAQGKWAQPKILRSVPKEFAQFKTWATKEGEFALSTTKHGMEFPRMLAALAAAGAISFDILDNLVDYLHSKWSQRPGLSVRNQFPKASRGVPGALGYDLGDPVGVTDIFTPRLGAGISPVLNDLVNFYKASPGIAHDLWDTPTGSLENEKAKEQFYRNISPEARRIWDAEHQYGDALRDPVTGKPILDNLTFGEKMALAIGVTPLRVAQNRDFTEQAKLLNANYNDAKGYFVSEIAKSMLAAQNPNIGASERSALFQRQAKLISEAVKNPFLAEGLDTDIEAYIENANIPPQFKELLAAPEGNKPAQLNLLNQANQQGVFGGTK